jgi:hypothetical protein
MDLILTILNNLNLYKLLYFFTLFVADSSDSFEYSGNLSKAKLFTEYKNDISSFDNEFDI